MYPGWTAPPTDYPNTAADNDAPDVPYQTPWTGHPDAPFYRRRLAEAQRRDALGIVDELTQTDAYGKRLSEAMEVLANIMSPAVYPDLFPVAANTTVRRPYTGMVGIWELDYILLMPPGGTYPSRVDVLCPGIAATPFSLTSAKPELLNMGFRVFGGQELVVTNADATNAATIYVRWKISQAGAR